MKKSILSLSVAAAMLVQLPAYAAEPARATAAKSAKPAKKAGKPSQKAKTPKAEPSARMEAFASAAAELTDALGAGKGNPIPLLEKLSQYQPTADTRAKLMKNFGVPTLFTVKPVAAPLNKVAYGIVSPANRFTDQKGETIEWAALDVKLVMDKEGRQMVSTGSWPFLTFTDKTTQLSVTDMTLSGDQTRSMNDIWLGKANMRIAKVGISGVKGGPAVSMENMSFDTNVVQRGKVVDAIYDGRIQAIKMMGEQIDNFRIATRLTNVDMEALQTLSTAMTGKDKNLDPSKALDAYRSELTAFAKSMSENGSAFEIEEFSMAYRGHKAQVSGRVALAGGMTDADFASFEAVTKKLHVRMDVRVPLALLKELSLAVTRKQAAGKEEPMSEEAIASTAQSITDVMVGKAITSGFARLENEVLMTTFDMKEGKLTLNNKPLDMPKKPSADDAAPVKPAKK